MFLIHLFKEILKIRKDITLQIVGDTLPAYQSYLNELKLKVNEYKLEKNILFLGFVPCIKTALQNSDFFIHAPTEPDPAPAVILEAIESRTAVIYTDEGGAREILDKGKNGLKINSNSIQKSSKLILKYISQNKIQNKRIKDSIKFVSKNFNKELYKTKLLRLLLKI